MVSFYHLLIPWQARQLPRCRVIIQTPRQLPEWAIPLAGQAVASKHFDIASRQLPGRGAGIRTLTTGFGDLHATINITPLWLVVSKTFQ